MENSTLAHYGVRGMKWGVRRTPEQLARASGRPLKKKTGGRLVRKTKRAASASPAKKSLSELSDDELRAKISRLELEKKYKDLARSESKKVNRGKKIAMDILEGSGKNIAGQLTTYMMGAAVNKAFEGVFKDKQIVNPKKGQKDK